MGFWAWFGIACGAVSAVSFTALAILLVFEMGYDEGWKVAKADSEAKDN